MHGHTNVKLFYICLVTVYLTLWHLTSGIPTKSVMLKMPNVRLT